MYVIYYTSIWRTAVICTVPCWRTAAADRMLPQFDVHQWCERSYKTCAPSKCHCEQYAKINCTLRVKVAKPKKRCVKRTLGRRIHLWLGCHFPEDWPQTNCAQQSSYCLQRWKNPLRYGNDDDLSLNSLETCTTNTQTCTSTMLRQHSTFRPPMKRTSSAIDSTGRSPISAA